MGSLRYGEYTIDDKAEFIIDDEREFNIKRISSNVYQYERYENNELKLTKIIVSDLLRLGIYPITPQNVPSKYAEYMMIVFDPIVLENNSSLICYLTMPIEIGITVSNSIIDVLSLNTTKYSLYGTPERGIICRYYKSKVYTDLQTLYPLPLREAIVSCKLKNYSGSTKSISKIVFPIEGIDLYYNDIYAYFDMLDITIESKIIDIVNIKIASMEWNANKTNFGKEAKNTYLMEWGF